MRGPLATAALVLAASGAFAEELVTPIRVGRSDAAVKVTVWAQQDYSHLASRPAIAAIFRGIMEDYARTHPDVQLEISAMPALEMHKAKLLLAASAGRLPDVASVDSFWMPLFLDGGHVQPLEPYWPAEDRADYLPFTIDTLSDAQGHVYGIWHGTDCRLLYYRKDLVPTPPATWDELLDVASRITREKKIAGYLYNAGRWEGAVFDHLAMFWAQGGELVDAAGRPIFGVPPHHQYMVDVLAFLRQTIERGASPLAVLSHSDYQQLTSAAIAGDAAMFLGGNWQLGDLEAGLPPEEFAKWDVAKIPQKNAGTQSTGTGGWVWVMFARDPVRQRAAAEFLQFVESPANVGRITQATGHLPVRRSVFRDVPFFRDSPWHRKFADMVVHGKARPAAAAYPAISQQLQIAVGAAVSGDKTPEQAVDDAWRAVLASTARRAGQQTAAGRDWLALVPMLGALLLAVAVLWPLRGAQGPLRLWLLPAIVLSTALIVYPILDLARVALTDTGAYGSPHRYTLESFRSLLAGREFYQMAALTLVFVAASVSLQLGLGLAVAVLVDAARRRGARLTLLARAAVVSAWVIPGVLVGVLWRILLVENRSGIVNHYLSLIGLGPLPLLSSAGLAMASVIAANTWRGCAFSMILQFAGLQRIPQELHEAADLEGLRPWARLRMLILPQLAPVLALNLILITIQTLNTFDLILPLTGGGPARRTEVISLFMYRAAFYDLETGRAAAAAVLLLALNIGLAVLAARLILAPAEGRVKTRKAPLVAGLALVAAAFLLPQLWLLSVSLKTKAGVYEYPPRWLPESASMANYAFVLSRTQVPTYLANSAKVALLATLLTLAVGIPAAYVLSRERFKRREGILGSLVAAQMISPVVLLVPIYGLIAALRLLDTHTGLALVYGAVQVPFTIIVLKTFFDALPPSLLEAARLDGATRWLTLRRVALPLIAPGLAATATFNLAAYWSEFALSLVLLDTQSRFTIPIGLFSFQSGYETEWNLVAAASFLGLVPVMAGFALLQRFFVAGLTAGAVKG